jgi:hypothetical protein
MRKIIFPEGHWLYCAGSTRMLADEADRPECRHILQEIAETYEYLAGLSELWQHFRTVPANLVPREFE